MTDKVERPGLPLGISPNTGGFLEGVRQKYPKDKTLPSYICREIRERLEIDAHFYRHNKKGLEYSHTGFAFFPIVFTIKK